MDQPWLSCGAGGIERHMTRILLPAQIFLFAGNVLGATLLVRKQFLYQAATPIIYNLSIITFGVLLHRRLGISSLAVGATVGFLSVRSPSMHGVSPKLEFATNGASIFIIPACARGST